LCADRYNFYKLFKPAIYQKAEVSRDVFLPQFRGYALAEKYVKVELGIAAVLIVSGMYILFSRVIFPVVESYAATEAYKPIHNTVNYVNVGSSDSQNGSQVFSDFVSAAKKDFESIKKERTGDIPEKFYITIPKLEIFDAEIETNSHNTDPKSSLAHFYGSCLPDEACNVFIYGHSTSKWVKNKYLNGDYTSIFTNLEKLTYGDEIYISFSDKTYKYMVDQTSIKKPEEIDPFTSPYKNEANAHKSSLELFTCSPPGTTKYRLSVTALPID
jgi:LPXTG-site transpeptidase (sortase) family protein